LQKVKGLPIIDVLACCEED